MRNFFKELFYYFLFGSFIGRVDNRYSKLDILKIYFREIGIKAISQLDDHTYDYYIIFNDDTTLYISYTTKFTFMRRGIMKFSNDKELKWQFQMPSYEVLYLYNKAIKKYKKEIECDYYEYLPVKLQRKLKLKNIKKY